MSSYRRVAGEIETGDIDCYDEAEQRFVPFVVRYRNLLAGDDSELPEGRAAGEVNP
jgi:hypothetical protein